MQPGYSGGQNASAPPNAQKLAGYNVNYSPQYTPGQMKMFEQMLGMTGQGSDLAKLAGGDQSFMSQLEAPAKRQFAGQQANLAGRYSSAGMGGRHSSGFQNEATNASSNFAQQLQSQRMNLQRQAQQDLQGMSRDLLGATPYGMQLSKPNEKKSWWQQLLGGAAPFAGAAIGGSFGGAPGAKFGSEIGQAFGAAFQ